MNANAWTSLGEQPVVPQPLSRDKMDALRQDMGWLAAQAGVHSAKQWVGFVQNYTALTRAMIGVIDPAPTNTVTQALATAVAGPSGGLSYEAALQSVQSVLLNRRDDLTASLPLLASQEFTGDIFRTLASRGFQASGDFGPLPPAKRQELMETLLQPRNGRLEPAAHIHATALGHAAVHARLAEAFAPGGMASSHMLDSLKRATPPAEGASLAGAYVTRWLQRREVRARQVADAYREDGPLVQSAVRLSEENRLSRMPLSAPGPLAPTAPVSYMAPHTPESAGQPGTLISGVMSHMRVLLQPLFGQRAEKIL